MKIVSLSCGDYTAKINLSRGANCISLRNNRYNVKILNEPDYNNLDNPYIYGMPILFPVNRISGGEFEFEGRKYSFPVNEPETGCHVHGILHETEFEAEEVSESRIACRYLADENKPYFTFPHSFEIKIEYELSDKGLLHKTTVINHSDKNMPYFLGFHTSFNTLFVESCTPDSVTAYADIREEFERDKMYLPTGKIPEFDDVSKKLSSGEVKPFNNPFSRHYRAGADGRMMLCDGERGLRVVYENDKKYRFRLIYNSGDTGYICLEPQTCIVDCPNTVLGRENSGFDYIAPNEEKCFVSRIYLEDPS